MNRRRLFSAQIESLRPILSFIDRGIREVVHDPLTEMKILLAAEEAVVNVVQYAYPEQVDGTLGVAYDVDDAHTYFKVILEDQGIPFNPIQRGGVRLPNFSQIARGWELGGCGIFLILEMMDQVEYHRFEQTNQLILTKFLRSA